jgi:uncharacterized membrane protein
MPLLPRSPLIGCPGTAALALTLLVLTAAACDDAAVPTPTTDAATQDGASESGAPDMAVAADADASPAAGQFFPCDVEAVLRAKCHTCHTMPPRNGAPMSLLTWAATQNLASGSATQKIWERARDYVANNYMPYMGSPTGPLTPAEKATLLGWLTAGAPPAAQACPSDAGADAP